MSAVTIEIRAKTFSAMDERSAEVAEGARTVRLAVVRGKCISATLDSSQARLLMCRRRGEECFRTLILSAPRHKPGVT